MQNDLFMNLCSRSCALTLLMLGAPVLALIALALLVTQGWPLLYRGTRLGKDRREFSIYKFRTLNLGAEQALGSDMLAHWHGLETPLGAFMRDTRLDELPQLVNVLMGDMAFIGPRPLRPLVAQHLENGGEDVSWRLATRPGLIAPAHLFTPHGTTERIRQRLGRITTMAFTSKGIAAPACLVALTALALLRRIALAGKVSCRYCTGKRNVSRHSCSLREQGDWRVNVLQGDKLRAMGPLVEINESAFVTVCDTLPPSEALCQLHRPFTKRGRKSSRNAWCHGVLIDSGIDAQGLDFHIYCHTPASDQDAYIINKYFLRKSLA